jgi:hypothetical protein
VGVELLDLAPEPAAGAGRHDHGPDQPDRISGVHDGER